jgi:hypothetical protein
MELYVYGIVFGKMMLKATQYENMVLPAAAVTGFYIARLH